MKEIQEQNLEKIESHVEAARRLQNPVDGSFIKGLEDFVVWAKEQLH
jgi:hypothetical protein